MVAVQVMFGGVLFGTVAVLVAVLVLLYTMPKLSQQQSCDILCLKSNSFSQGPDIYCSCLSDRLQDYLDEAIKSADMKLYDSDIQVKTPEPSLQLMSLLKNLRWNIKPSARVTGKKQQSPTHPYAEMIPLREWVEKGEGGFLRYGMEYRHGRLVVPVKGSYLIYSFLDLYESYKNKISTLDKKPTGIKHAIYRFNIQNGIEEELITSEHPREVSQNGFFNVYNSYLSAAVSLNPGDEVYVKISDIELLAHPNSNYFGVSMI